MRFYDSIELLNKGWSPAQEQALRDAIARDILEADAAGVTPFNVTRIQERVDERRAKGYAKREADLLAADYPGVDADALLAAAAAAARVHEPRPAAGGGTPWWYWAGCAAAAAGALLWCRRRCGKGKARGVLRKKTR